jgi:hypothetical protein
VALVALTFVQIGRSNGIFGAVTSGAVLDWDTGLRRSLPSVRLHLRQALEIGAVNEAT